MDLLSLVHRDLHQVWLNFGLDLCVFCNGKKLHLVSTSSWWTFLGSLYCERQPPTTNWKIQFYTFWQEGSVPHSGPHCCFALMFKLKGCVCYIFASLFWMSKRGQLWSKEKCFLFHFESSPCSWDNQILTF